MPENKNVIYSDLKTDEEGKSQINHLIPGKYYLKEIRTKEGYEKYEELIELQVALHEQFTVKSLIGTVLLTAGTLVMVL